MQSAIVPQDRRRRGIYLLPNLFTTAALFAGFYAVVAAMGERFEAAAVADGRYSMRFRSELSLTDVPHDYYYSDSFFAHSASGNNSSQPRRLMAKACATSGLMLGLGAELGGVLAVMVASSRQNKGRARSRAGGSAALRG